MIFKCVCSWQRYFVIVEAIVSGYNLMILFLASKGSLWRIVIILDVVKKSFFFLFFAFLFSYFYVFFFLWWTEIVVLFFWFEQFCTGCGFVTYFKHVSSLGNSSSGQEREHSCWLAAHLWTSPQVLQSCNRSSCCWHHCSSIIFSAYSLHSLHCSQSSVCCKTLILLFSFDLYPV